MIPRVAKAGKSFKGAGLYYLHDKGHAKTKDRVLFTHTENLPTRDPDKALKCMAWTAMNAQQIKLRAGGKPISKLELPVYSYSLSWYPDQEPTKDQMIDAAKETLKILGLDKHETLFVAHGDTPHPHIHVIVNRVNPETGITQEMPNDFNKFSRWAQGYELKWGKILCEQRVENNRRRDAGEYVKYDEKTREQAFSQWRRKRANEGFKRRKAEIGSQRAQHRDQRESLMKDKEGRIASQRAENRALARPEWKALYAQQKLELRNLRRMQRLAGEKIRQTFRDTEQARPGDRAVRSLYRARNPQPVPGPLRAPKGRRASMEEKKQARGAAGPPTGKVRVSDWLRAEKEERGGYLREAFQLSGLWAIELAERHKKERTTFAEHLKRITDRQLKEIKERYAGELFAMKARQKDEARTLTYRHLDEREIAEYDKRTGYDRTMFRDQLRDQLARELGENKRDIQRPFSLADKFNKARAQTREQEFRQQAKEVTGRPLPESKEAPEHGARQKQPEPGRKQIEFREQAKDTTERTPQESKQKTSLAEQFRKAREEAAPDRSKTEIFWENAKDAGMDIGRERSRKPPGHKPD